MLMQKLCLCMVHTHITEHAERWPNFLTRLGNIVYVAESWRMLDVNGIIHVI